MGGIGSRRDWAVEETSVPTLRGARARRPSTSGCTIDLRSAASIKRGPPQHRNTADSSPVLSSDLIRRICIYRSI